MLKIVEFIRSKAGGPAISDSREYAASGETETLVARARQVAGEAPGDAASQIMIELCSVVENLNANQTDVRREAFRDAVRGIANVIRNGQLPPDLALTRMMPGGYGSAEALASEIERADASQPVRLGELRQLRQKLKAATEGSDELDEAVKRVYYANVFGENPSTEYVLPPGSPSRSLDLATLVVQRVVPNGWWTMGSSGVNIVEPAVAKVGTWTGDNPKPETGPSTPIALLSAMVLTLIEAAKKDG
jgi:hypothetical protein